jgi:hypothetical protein
MGDDLEGGCTMDLGYKETDGAVVLTMTPGDWSALLLTMGYATASATRNDDRELRDSMLALMNRLIVGNPQFTPYWIPGDPPEVG